MRASTRRVADLPLAKHAAVGGRGFFFVWTPRNVSVAKKRRQPPATAENLAGPFELARAADRRPDSRCA